VRAGKRGSLYQRNFLYDDSLEQQLGGDSKPTEVGLFSMKQNGLLSSTQGKEYKSI